MKALNIQIEDHQHEWLRQKAFAERISMAQVVREAINKSMKEEGTVKSWENAVGKSLREVLEGTYEKKAEDIYVDNADLEWYQGNLDETVIQARRSLEGSSEALITENLAWVDYPTQICVYEAQAWADGEGLGWIQLGKGETIAERIAGLLGDDGTCWEGKDGRHFDQLCEDAGADVSLDRERELKRYLFPDGSAIVAGVGGWDIEGEEPFSWEGAE